MKKPWFGHDREGVSARTPLIARDYMISNHLGQLPCLLSTPSMVDLSIRVPDLVARLVRYQEMGTNALEGDLFLALARLDIPTKTPQAVDTLRTLDIPIMLQTGKKMSVTAGEVVLKYLDDPIKEPTFFKSTFGSLRRKDIAPSAALADFPNRFDYLHEEVFSIFPFLGDVGLEEVQWRNADYCVRETPILLCSIGVQAPLLI